MATLREIEKEIWTILLLQGPEERRGWRRQVAAKTAEYKKQCLELHGLADHPKADAVWEFAWEEGHAYGLHNVDIWVQRLAELIKD